MLSSLMPPHPPHPGVPLQRGLSSSAIKNTVCKDILGDEVSHPTRPVPPSTLSLALCSLESPPPCSWHMLLLTQPRDTSAFQRKRCQPSLWLWLPSFSGTRLGAALTGAGTSRPWEPVTGRGILGTESSACGEPPLAAGRAPRPLLPAGPYCWYSASATSEPETARGWPSPPSSAEGALSAFLEVFPVRNLSPLRTTWTGSDLEDADHPRLTFPTWMQRTRHEDV